jgi:hypothetical protein
VAAPAFYSVYWTFVQASELMANMAVEDLRFRRDGPPRAARLNDIDCRSTVGAHLGDALEPAYIESSDYYEVMSCRPNYSFGRYSGSWQVRMEPWVEPLPQLKALDENVVARDEDLHAICGKEGVPDPVCARAMRSRCGAYGESYLRCMLTPSDRDALLGRASSPTRTR